MFQVQIIAKGRLLGGLLRKERLEEMEEFKGRRVAIYARVSTEEQAEHGYSIEGQKKC